MQNGPASAATISFEITVADVQATKLQPRFNIKKFAQCSKPRRQHILPCLKQNQKLPSFYCPPSKPIGAAMAGRFLTEQQTNISSSSLQIKL